MKMTRRFIIRKILFAALWTGIGGGMLVLLLAAMSKREKGVCSGYLITLQGAPGNRFMDEKEVEQLLRQSLGGSIQGKPVGEFPLHELERKLEKDPWVSKADLYFDNREVLHVSVTEREPLARVFTVSGKSFYLDSACHQLPLSARRSARVPVFTGFPDRARMTRADSVLLRDMRTAGELILRDPFWMAQVAQIDRTDKGQFEMIPVVGNHLVRLGDGQNMDAKLRRLLVFYRQVLSRSGMDYYKWIDVQYSGQVVASRRSGMPGVDSLQLRRNVDRLLRQLQEAPADTMTRALPARVQLEDDRSEEVNAETLDLPQPAKPVALPEKRKDQPAPASPAKKSGEGSKIEPQRQPRALMPPREKKEEDRGYN